MTVSVPTIPSPKTEGVPAAHVAPSLEALFASFLGTLPRLLSDERDLCGYSGQDPAVDAWIRAADASLAATKAACGAVLAAPASGAAELNLQRVARLFIDVIRSADPDEVACLRTHARLRRWAYSVPSEVTGARTINMMIASALDRFESWLSLEDAFDARAEAWSDKGLDLPGTPDLGPAF
ncbi:hypothetical protein [Nioella ostreopsis]|uniref:hypothetical protein n=1 Tax=Nioella ostreopsis TaxID=2448479 RepID=UPI000FDB39DE|nr:hypothetical protein [Nioella ostreopsis]